MKKYSILLWLCGFLIACSHRQSSFIKDTQTDSTSRLPYYNSADFSPHWLKGDEAVPDTTHTIAAFSFTDQDGKKITPETTAGKIYVANFFFTSCRGICPKLTSNLSIVQDSLINDDNVMLLSYSVMPETDDTASLQRYAKNYHVNSRRWHLLTGNKDSIYTAARKSYFADDDPGDIKTVNDFLHTENMLLIDTHRHIRGIYKGTSQLEMQSIIDDIKILEKEK